MTRRTMLLMVLCLAGASLAGCSRPKKPEFRTLRNVKFKGARLTGNVILSADAVFHNDNGFGVTVTRMAVDVYIDGRKAADIEQRVAAEMRAQSDFTLPIEMDIPARELYQDGASLLSGILSRRKVQLKMDGWVEVQAAGFDFRIPFSHEKESELRF